MDSTERDTETAGLRHAARAQRTTGHLVLVLEGGRPLAGGARHVLENVDEVRIGRGTERSARRVHEGGTRRLHLTIPDRRASSAHMLLTRRGDEVEYEDLGSSNGSWVDFVPATRGTLADGDVIEIGHTFFRYRAAVRTPTTWPGDIDDEHRQRVARGCETLDPCGHDDLATLARVARSRVPLLLLGETGTGKEVLARYVHVESGRPGPFVAVNCGALTSGLAEAQLFGHVRGAFTGAVSAEAGFVRAAHGGTLFLDEIGDLAAPAQAALLRVLEESEVVPVGATRGERVDVRVVAATHRPIDDEHATGFRPDLLARVAGFVHRLPTLRDRIDDIGVLVARILPHIAGDRALVTTFRPPAIRALLAHGWPHNVRELSRCLEVATLLAKDGGAIGGDALPKEVVHGGLPVAESTASLSAADEALRKELVERLRQSNGNVTQVSQAMGKARFQIQRWIRRFGIDAAAFRR